MCVYVYLPPRGMVPLGTNPILWDPHFGHKSNAGIHPIALFSALFSVRISTVFRHWVRAFLLPSQHFMRAFLLHSIAFGLLWTASGLLGFKRTLWEVRCITNHRISIAIYFYCTSIAIQHFSMRAFQHFSIAFLLHFYCNPALFYVCIPALFYCISIAIQHFSSQRGTPLHYAMPSEVLCAFFLCAFLLCSNTVCMWSLLWSSTFSMCVCVCVCMYVYVCVWVTV